MREHARRSSVPIAPVSKLPDTVFDYFAGQILDKLDSTTRAFLLDISLLTRFTVATAQAISTNENAGAILEHMHRHHLFTDRHDGAVPSYQFHPLFREVCLARAMSMISATKLAELAALAGSLVEADGDLNAAAHFYVRAQAWPDLVRLICQNGPAMLALGLNQTLESWIQCVPKEVEDSAPWLRFWQAMARLALDPPASRKIFENCYPKNRS